VAKTKGKIAGADLSDTGIVNDQLHSGGFGSGGGANSGGFTNEDSF
jgi:hypothetical protein